MYINTVHLDYDMIRSCYVSGDLITRTIRKNGNYVCDYARFYKTFDKRYVGLRMRHRNEIIVGINIESDDVSNCYVAVNNFVVSQFHIAKGKHHYQQWILHNFSCVDIMLDEHNVINVEILSILQDKCDMLNNQMIQNVRTHRVLKISEFGVNLAYHSNCSCSIMCSFFDSEDMHDYDQHDVRDDCDNKIHPLIKTSKIKEICKRIIILFRTVLIKDVLTHIGTIMLAIV